MDLNKYSVTWKVTGMFILILLLSFVIHVIFIVPRFKEHSENYARSILQETALGVASSIDGVLKQAVGELENIAKNPDMMSLDPARMDRTLLLLDNVTPNFLSIWVQDNKGIVISRPDKTERVGADLSDMAYFIDVHSSGRTTVSDFFVSTSGHLTTTIATPIAGPDGSVRGVLVGSLGIDERNIDLFRSVTSVSIGQSGFAYLVDSMGKLIANPKVSQTQASLERLDYSSLPYIRELISEKTGSGAFISNGEPIIVGYAPVPTSGWGVVVQQPESEMPNYSGSLLTYFLSIFAAMFLISGILSVVFTRHLLRPLKLLGQSAGPQMEGLTNENVKDEIQILSSHIGKMVDQIKSSEFELKKVNEDLKAEIVQRRLAEEKLRFNLAILDLQLERSPDGILVVDSDERIISYNQRFKDIWSIPKTLLEEGYDPPVLEHIQRQMTQPEEFFERVQYLYKNPMESSREDIQLKDGRILERHTEPMTGSDDTHYGRVWYFHDITDQKRSENEIRQSLHEKETLLKEVHHRVKNNLHAVSSILDLQTTYLSNEEAKKLCQDSKNKILTMALLHEYLYRGKDQTKVDLKNYLSELTDHIKSSMDGNQYSIRISTAFENLSLNLDTAIPCGLIVTELVSNAIKHAFKDRDTGTIKVEVFQDAEDTYRLKVSDDGVGLPENWDSAYPPTLGLKLVQSFVEQLSGTFDVTTEAGTTFTVTFKEYKEYQGIL